MIGNPNVGNLLDDESSTFKHLPKLRVWLGTRHSINNLFDGYQLIQQWVPSRQRTEGNQDPFSTAFDLRKLDH